MARTGMGEEQGRAAVRERARWRGLCISLAGVGT